MIAKAFKNAPISDFHNEKSATYLTKDVNGYTWSQMFAGRLQYKETIAVPLNMPPAMVPSFVVLRALEKALHSIQSVRPSQLAVR